MVAEAGIHLKSLKTRCFASFLHGHVELHHVEEKLEQQLILLIARLLGKRQKRLAIFQGQTRRQRYAGALAGRYDVERIFFRVQHKRLHPLTHADARITRNAGRHPPAAGRNGNNPSFFVGGFNGGCAGSKTVLKFLVQGGIVFSIIQARASPFFQHVLIRIGLTFKRIRVTGARFGVVHLRINKLAALFGVFFGKQTFHRFFGPESRVAVVKIAVGKGQIHGLIQRVNVAG